MTDQHSSLPPLELVTESSWISGLLAREQVIDAAGLASVLNLGEYGLQGRSLIESGRLVDILNNERGYVTVSQARIQPMFPIELLDRQVETVAVSTADILCAAPLQEQSGAPASTVDPPVGPPGESARELRTVELQVGPIFIRGDLHVMPGSDPVVAFFRRDLAFIPLTSASATYLPEPQRKWTREVLIVNRRRTQIVFTEGAVGVLP